jgi:NAD(P)-dependent dehydrogenase (short-subunit alcohol dehydrogenase family)
MDTQTETFCNPQKGITMHSQPVALITGANQGIGLQIAKELAGHGFTVLIGSRNLSRGETAALTIDGTAHAIQLDVTDHTSVMAAASRIQSEFGRLDVLIQNAAVSKGRVEPGRDVAYYASMSKPGNLNLNDMRTVWETNVFGVITVYQTMLPLIRSTPGSRIINMSSGAGSLTANSDPAFPHRVHFGPVYPGSKTALNALTLAMSIELEAEGIPVNAVSPGFVKTNLNGFAGTDSVEQGAREAVRVALLGRNGPTGKFTRWESGSIPW